MLFIMGNNVVKPPSYLDTLNIVDIKSAQTLTNQFDIRATELYDTEYERICILLVKTINEKITFNASNGCSYIQIILKEKQYKFTIPFQYKRDTYEDLYFNKLIKFIKMKYKKYIINIDIYIDNHNKSHMNQLLEIMW